MKESIRNILKDLKKVGCDIVYEDGKYRSKKKYGTGNYGGYLYYTERELYKLHKASFKNQVKSDVKKFTNDKDRAAARDKLKMEKFDDIPSKKRVREADPWSYD